MGRMGETRERLEPITSYGIRLGLGDRSRLRANTRGRGSRNTFLSQTKSRTCGVAGSISSACFTLSAPANYALLLQKAAVCAEFPLYLPQAVLPTISSWMSPMRKRRGARGVSQPRLWRRQSCPAHSPLRFQLSRKSKGVGGGVSKRPPPTVQMTTSTTGGKPLASTSVEANISRPYDLCLFHPLLPMLLPLCLCLAGPFLVPVRSPCSRERLC